MKNYKIIPADLEKNKQDIISLRKINLEEITPESYAWKYQNSPAGKAECLLAVSENECIGATAIFPRCISANGGSTIGGISGDFSVNKEHRVLGLAAKLQKEMAAKIKEDNRIKSGK